MKISFTKKLNLLALSLILVASMQLDLNAQVPSFWSEDFSGGAIPAGWLNEDVSENNTFWTWCADPATGQIDGCPALWNGAVNQQLPFSSTTAQNGFVVMDSDIFQEQPFNHLTQLTTSAIDCSAESEVFIRFESHIGIFSFENGAKVRVTTTPTDTSTWQSFDVFPELTTGDRWSANPETVIIDISEPAAGQSNVYIQFFWEGNWEYMWSIDDITLHGEDPTLPNDMRVNVDFFSVPANAATPISQVTPINFLADIENIGRLDQENVNLNIKITNLATSEVVHEQDLPYGQIIVDSLAQNVFFPESFTPTAVGDYEGVYTVSSDSTDTDPTNDTQTFLFSITDSTFAKSNGVGLGSIGPNPAPGSNWQAGEPHTWGMGVYYWVPSGGTFEVSTVSFGITNPDELAGQSLILWLYEFTDANGDRICQQEERTSVGVNSYEISGDEVSLSILTMPLIDVLGAGPVTLKDNQGYILMAEFVSPDDQTDLSLAAERNINYNAQNFQADSLSDETSFASFGYIGTETDYTPNNFGPSTTPYLTMNIYDPNVTNTDELAEENLIKVYPNPVSDQLILDVQLANTIEDFQVTIRDVSGKLVSANNYRDVLNRQLTYDVSDFVAGTYTLQVQTTNGMRTERFVVMK